MKLVSKKEDGDEKMRYLIKGMKSYNKYLSKQFRCQIDYFEVYSKIINSPAKERTESIKMVTNAFEVDKSEVLNHLTRCLEDEKEQILPANSFGDRLQRLGASLDHS